MKPHEKMEMELAADMWGPLIPMMLGMYPSIAKLSRTYYLELTKEGFSDSEALKIVCEQGVKARME